MDPHLATIVARDADVKLWLVKKSELPALFKRLEEIEDECFGPHAWNKGDFAKIVNTKSGVLLVARNRRDILGYVVYAIVGRRIEVWNIAVAWSAQRLGIGTLMLNHIKGKLGKKYRRIAGIVLETNLDALAFLRANGFRWHKTLHKPFEGEPDVDGYLMRYQT